MSSRGRILLVCVNYHSDESTLRYLRSWAALAGSEDVEAVVVDNTERDHGFTCGQDVGLRVRCLKPATNLGYLGGANHGFQEYLRRAELPDWCIVSNVDLEMKSCDFISSLLSLRGESGLGVVAPSIVSRVTKIDQNPWMRRRPSIMRMRAYRYLYSSYSAYYVYERCSFAYRLIRGALRTRGYKAAPKVERIYAPHGAFMAFARSFFERGGTFHYPVFLFGEEIYVAEQARQSGLSILYVPELKLEHAEHETIGRFKSRAMMPYLKQSAKFCVEHYF